MNKLKKILLATLGGLNTVVSVTIPILVVLLWIRTSEVVGISSYILIGAGFLASLFRAIKIGWWTDE